MNHGKKQIFSSKTLPFFLSGTQKSRIIIISSVVCYMLVCLFVPLGIYNKQAVFIFSAWNLYSGTFMHNRVFDIVWESKDKNQGYQYLIRDHLMVRNPLTKRYSLYFLIRNRLFSRIKADYYDWIKQYCHCQKIYIIELSGSYSDHFIFKKELPIKKHIVL